MWGHRGAKGYILKMTTITLCVNIIIFTQEQWIYFVYVVFLCDTSILLKGKYTLKGAAKDRFNQQVCFNHWDYWGTAKIKFHSITTQCCDTKYNRLEGGRVK